MVFSSIDIRKRALDKDLTAHLPQAQHGFLDDYMHKLAGVLIGKQELEDAIDNAARMIAEEYLSEGIDTIIVIDVLNGATTASAKLKEDLFKYGLRRGDDYTKTSRFGTGTKGGAVTFLLDVKNIEPNDHVLIVEDIFDEGITYEEISKRIGVITPPANIKRFSLLFKPDKYKGNLKINYPVFKVDDHWVAGFGMDLSAKMYGSDDKMRGWHRDLPFVAATNPDYLLENRLIDEAGAQKLRDLIKYKE
jgi:hypoxanthine phosphoribosyltransferase